MGNSGRWAVVCLLIVALLAMLGGCAPREEEPQPLATLSPGGQTDFTVLSVEDLTVTDDLAVTDDLTVTDDSALNGLVVFGSTDLTVTTGSTLTAVSSAYHLDSAGAVTVTLAACVTDGQLLILFGDDANTITVNDTNIRTSTGSTLAIGQYDVATFICMDTEWI